MGKFEWDDILEFGYQINISYESIYLCSSSVAMKYKFLESEMQNFKCKNMGIQWGIIWREIQWETF